MLTIIQEPPFLCLSRNPIWYRMFSDNYKLSSGNNAVFDITIPLNVTPGSVFTLTLNGHNYTFTCVNTGVASNGYNFATYSNLTEFNTMVDDYFKQSYYLNKYFTITGTYLSNKITLTAKESGTKYNLVMTGNTGGISIATVTSGTDDTYRPNYRSFVDLHLQEDYTASPADNLLSQLESDPHQDNVTGALAADEFVMDYEFQEILNAQLSPHIPTTTQNTIIKATGILKSFWLRFGEIFGDDPVVNWNDYNGLAGQYHQVLLGECPKDKDPEDLTDSLEDLEFLNRQPRTKLNTPASREYLFKFLKDAHTTLYAHVKIYYSDGTTHSTNYLSKASTESHQVYVIPAGFDQCGFNIYNPTKTPVRYEIYLINNLNVVVSETMVFLPETTSFEQTTELLFVGQCGAAETVHCTGYSSYKVLSESQTFQKARLPWETYTDASLMHSLSKQTERILISTGYKTRDYIEWLKDLAQGETLYVRNGSDWIPHRIIKDSISDMPTELSDLYSITFEIEKLTKG